MEVGDEEEDEAGGHNLNYRVPILAGRTIVQDYLQWK